MDSKTGSESLGSLEHNEVQHSPWLDYIQYNLDGSNMDGSFTLHDSNSFLSP